MQNHDMHTNERTHDVLVDGPFSLPLMLASVLRRVNDAVDQVIGDEYRRLLVHRERPFLVQVTPSDDVATLRIILCGVETPPDAADIAVAEQAIRRLFSLDHSPQAFYEQVRDEPVLGPITRRLHGMRPVGSPSIFEMLIIAVLGQQISMIAAGAIKSRLVAALGASASFDGQVYRAFPTPEAIANTSNESLLTLAFSRRKAEYVRDLAIQVASGDLDLEALRGREHGEILERLIAIRGIGRWTAEYVLLRGYGYPDALPAGDAGLRRQIMRHYQLAVPPDEAEIIRRGAAWSPYRSWATLYLWNADLAPNNK
jgi:DNA-3-methyladenine glycosylase II